MATFLDTLNINDSLSFGLNNYALNLQDIDFNKFREQTLAVNLGSVEDALISGGELGNSLKITSEESLANSTAAIQLPDRFLESNEQCSQSNRSNIQRLSYSVFLSNILFQSLNQSQFDIGSIIVSARVRCAVNSKPVTTYFRKVKQNINIPLALHKIISYFSDFRLTILIHKMVAVQSGILKH